MTDFAQLLVFCNVVSFRFHSLVLPVSFSDMLSKPIEGVAANDEEADKFWTFTQDLLAKAEQKQLQKRVSDPVTEQQSGQGESANREADTEGSTNEESN